MFENLIEKPRAIALVDDAVVWSDTGGGLFAVDISTNRTTTYVARRSAVAEMIITGLTYDKQKNCPVRVEGETPPGVKAKELRERGLSTMMPGGCCDGLNQLLRSVGTTDR